MLEMLFAFSIFLMLVSFLPLSFNFLFHDWKFDARTQRLEWLVFINQLKKEVRLADYADVSNDRIVLKVAGQNVVYEKYGSSLRRRVDLKGHEVVLQQVDSISFTSINGGLEMKVKDTFAQVYSASLYYYIDWAGFNVP
ncbi:ComGF family competence protein [Bacillus sp. ISL-47]|uniref:competence type IV pilus minor pilin ComGF n=1 Tax=Bacillus sp. ISL-47 TaxID=2819130 RepID=UPI001BE4E1B2|nr:competence type IV pilus minor pilin ComGF [Bacillus sp. ISL-47]MBT2687074.1 ComGF family competence protein [Bacillus sp. ISL-47]MBT2707374.1 ComGF family competence protein [Pseudomonas sp. ISL-84]